jgi:hypothetical protein
VKAKDSRKKIGLFLKTHQITTQRCHPSFSKVLIIQLTQLISILMAWYIMAPQDKLRCFSRTIRRSLTLTLITVTSVLLNPVHTTDRRSETTCPPRPMSEQVNKVLHCAPQPSRNYLRYIRKVLPRYRAATIMGHRSKGIVRLVGTLPLSRIRMTIPIDLPLLGTP